MGPETSTQVSLAPASVSGSERRPVPAISSNTGPGAFFTSSWKKGTSIVVVT